MKEIGSNVTGVQGDVAKLADLDRLYEITKEGSLRRGRVYTKDSAEEHR